MASGSLLRPSEASVTTGEGHPSLGLSSSLEMDGGFALADGKGRAEKLSFTWGVGSPETQVKQKPDLANPSER